MLLEAAMAELPRGELMMGPHSSSTTVTTLLQDDHEFGSRILIKKDASNHGRFAYKSSATMQAGTGGGPFQWESERGKTRSLTTKDEEEYKLPPIALSPIRISGSSSSPSVSRAQSPSSLTNKVIRSLVMNVKRPESSSSHSPESPFNRSPSIISSPRERKCSPLCALYGPVQGSSSPHCSATSSLRESNFNGSEDLNTPSTYSHLVYKSPILYSPYTPSPFYFSPLSTTSSQTSDIISARNSVADDPNSHAPNDSNASPHGLDMHIVHPHAAANGPILDIPDLHARQGNSHNSLSSFAHASSAHSEVDARLPHGSDSLSFASPEMEILDEGLTTNYNAGKGVENTMAEFINRGGPPAMMHRSFSTSRVTFADDYKRKLSQKKYYSAQLNASAQPKTSTLPLQDPTCSALDKLFPLRRPNQFKVGTERVLNGQGVKEQMEGTACSNVERNGEGVGSMSNPLERAAQEVVIQASDEEGYAYTPVASAFVFSPRRAPQNTSTYFMRSSSARVLKERDSINSHPTNLNKEHPELKPILKNTSHSHELGHDAGVHTETQIAALHRSGSQKISSVLLRFAEAQERLYNSAPASPHHHHPHHHATTMPTTPCLSMCSFLGRAFLCRSKLATGHLYE